jgi:hypothetical protein
MLLSRASSFPKLDGGIPNGARGHYPQFDEVLRNDMEFPTLRGQGFNCGTDDFALGIERLQRTKQSAGIY